MIKGKETLKQFQFLTTLVLPFVGVISDAGEWKSMQDKITF